MAGATATKDRKGTTPGEIVIEVNVSRNGDRSGNGELYFFPAQRQCRSRFKPFRTGSAPPPALTAIAEIPGVQIHLDETAKRGRITDAGLRAKPTLLQELKVIGANLDIPVTVGDPEEDDVYENLTPERVQAWKFWMRRAVDDGYAVERNGKKLPSLEDIKAAGNIPQVDLGNVLKEDHKWVVPPKGAE